MITAKLKRLRSPDAPNLEAYRPPDLDNFLLFVELYVGSDDVAGEDQFGVSIVTPDYLREEVQHDGPMILRHYLLVERFDYPKVLKTLQDAISRCSGETWAEVAQKVGRIGHWEFEDYRAKA